MNSGTQIPVVNATLVYENSVTGFRAEYDDLPIEKVRQIFRNQDWLRRNWSTPGYLWPGDSWTLSEGKET